MVAGLLALALHGLTSAAPISIDYASINATSVDDFENLVLTDPGVTFLEVFGFSVRSAGGINVFGVPEFCGQAGERCLYVLAPRASLVLDGFEHGVTAVGFVVSKVNEDDALLLTATGGSGIASFLLPTSRAYAISDPLGLSALVFDNAGAASGSASIYGLDKVVVGRVISAPPTVLILIGGLGMLATFRRSRNGQEISS